MLGFDVKKQIWVIRHTLHGSNKTDQIESDSNWIGHVRTFWNDLVVRFY